MDKSIQSPATAPVKPASVVIVDDHPVLVSFLTEVLEREGRYRVVGRAEKAAEAVELTRKLKPTLVMLDIGLVRALGGGFTTNSASNTKDMPHG